MFFIHSLNLNNFIIPFNVVFSFSFFSPLFFPFQMGLFPPQTTVGNVAPSCGCDCAESMTRTRERFVVRQIGAKMPWLGIICGYPLRCLVIAAMWGTMSVWWVLNYICIYIWGVLDKLIFLFSSKFTQFIGLSHPLHTLPPTFPHFPRKINCVVTMEVEFPG